MSFCLSNLILTGCATPYLQNGSVSQTFGRTVLLLSPVQFTEGKFGVPERNEVGLLAWCADENINKTLRVGSRLKNPPHPIWVTCVNDSWGVLFSNNMDIMKFQSFEHRSLRRPLSIHQLSLTGSLCSTTAVRKSQNIRRRRRC